MTIDWKPVFTVPYRQARWIAASAGHHLRTLARSLRFWALFLVGLFAILIAYYVVADRRTPLTTDAFIQAYVVQVAPQVGGQVVQVLVREGQQVAKGDLLFVLDARPFEHKVKLLEAKLVDAEHQVKKLEAELAAAEAEHRRLRAEAEYAHSVYLQEDAIYKKESTTKRKQLDALQKHLATAASVEKSTHVVRQTREILDAKVGTEHALVAEARALLAEARLNLEYTKVHAPCDGIITDLQLREGAYTHVGQPALTCIDATQWVVIANFRENCLIRMREGQPALVALQTSPGRLYPATVVSLGSGVGQGQGVPSGLLPAVKNKTSWVPLAQRFQVRLRFDAPDELPPLRVGMTGSVTVYTESEGALNRLTETVHQVIAWLYYL